MNFRRVNNYIGWIVFAIAAFVYLITMERTVSFWDCGEFIATAYKLQVAHSPGAPLFMMLGRLFTLFASAPDKVALMVNSMSAIMSAFTILFLFWTITHFARKLLVNGKEEGISTSNLIAIMGAGAVGALAYTFSDTFWFSAVEAEVYASSSFFTAIVFWAILKWEHNADNKYSDRWLILISYLMGLSIGVHLLNLLTIPALAMVYYFKKYTPTLKGGAIAFVIGCVLLGFVQYGLIQGIPILASNFELLFVNSFRLPFDSGAIFFIALLAVALAFLIIWAKRKGKYTLHLFTLCTIFVLIGYSSFVTIIIRSRADVPIDMTNPDDVMSLVSYLQRDQYGSQPLISGPDFTSRPVEYKKGKPVYWEVKKDGKAYYEQVGHRQAEPVYPSSEKRLFPRVWSSNHSGFYQNYLNLSEGEQPTAMNNYSFFFNYQMNWMWWRYFMWNYAGRQNDFQGTSLGEAQNGNWISGIKFIDKLYGRGDIDKMPAPYKNNRARNQLYFLPLVLGVLGLVYQFNRNKHDGTIIGLLFFFTGIAIVLYLNNTPQQPRERDYAYAGATYAFAIWIGLGVLMLRDRLAKFIKNAKLSSVIATLICLIAVPTLMAFEEWDDHDRSKKTFAYAASYNILNSCDSNAILFTVGDNDTYPVWYLQEVEGIRRDVRVVNLSLLGIDWYIDQLRNKINDADAVPMIWKPEHYAASNRNFVIYRPDAGLSQDRFYNLEEVINYLCTDDQRAQIQIVSGDYINKLPTKNFSLKVNREEVINNGIVSLSDSSNIVNEITFSISGETLDKSELCILNIIAGVAKEGWNRPIYFSGGFAGGNNYLGLDEYIRLEGLSNKLVPVRNAGSSTSIGGYQSTDLDKSYDLFMNKFLWGGAERKDVYFDEKNKYMMMTYRTTGAKVANALTAQGRNEDAVRVLDKIMTNITYESYQYDQTAWGIVEAYYKAGAKDKAVNIAEIIVRDYSQMLNYLLSLSSKKAVLAVEVDGRLNLGGIQFMSETARNAGDAENAERWKLIFDDYYRKVSTTIGIN